MSLRETIVEFASSLPKGVKIINLKLRCSEKQFIEYNNELTAWGKEQFPDFKLDINNTMKNPVKFGWSLTFDPSGETIELVHDRSLDNK